jgi:hypothetical protein
VDLLFEQDEMVLTGGHPTVPAYLAGLAPREELNARALRLMERTGVAELATGTSRKPPVVSSSGSGSAAR